MFANIGRELGALRDSLEDLVPVPGLLALRARAAWAIRLVWGAQRSADEIEQRFYDRFRT